MPKTPALALYPYQRQWLADQARFKIGDTKALDTSRAFAGGPHPEGKGKVPSLRGLIERGRYTDAADLASALKDGEMMGYDGLSSGGMGQVQRNISQLPETDIQAIADYIASLK